MSMDKYTTIRSQEINYNIRDNLEVESSVGYPFYKVYCPASGESTYATNGLKFDCIAKAETWGKELFFRWWGLDKWMVIRIDFQQDEKSTLNKIVRTIVPNTGVYQ